jgi:hypothetical protein
VTTGPDGVEHPAPALRQHRHDPRRDVPGVGELHGAGRVARDEDAPVAASRERGGEADGPVAEPARRVEHGVPGAAAPDRPAQHPEVAPAVADEDLDPGYGCRVRPAGHRDVVAGGETRDHDVVAEEPAPAQHQQPHRRRLPAW